MQFQLLNYQPKLLFSSCSLQSFDQVSKMVHSIKMGWMKPRDAKSKAEDPSKRFYMLWQTDDQVYLNNGNAESFIVS